MLKKLEDASGILVIGHLCGDVLSLWSREPQFFQGYESQDKKIERKKNSIQKGKN